MSATAIKEILGILTLRTETQETHRLRVTNNRLQREVFLLREQVRYEELRKKMAVDARTSLRAVSVPRSLFDLWLPEPDHVVEIVTCKP